ncbi:hypothetical protein SPRG_18809 [Saprolegnia parasitica CBS 223.65]|uniref:Transmembrane protein n=1 Tax=Saprolegnia parasitica (strain CBS 223.65) TaxID=695850 RepID=A0A067D2D2_SAPPC|nr:hypothetical protein SPRG_18809 [Saprolegnia parasitica CBS 223.65]KDO35645.1 hypothetical protein SPRG_18809 [Saprolegnia parasitica CBS 223.65]|eukprot:XP_012194026.1 hypothetical protein SPRG_18809 [Saprolegnia parasitica CBS 223.65]
MKTTAKRARASLEELVNYFFGLKSRVCDVPISVDFIIWRQNLSLLSMQSVLLNGMLYHEYRFSFFVFASIWVGRSFHNAQYNKKFGPRGILSHLEKPISFLKMNFIVSVMLIASFICLLRSTHDMTNLALTVLLPCTCSVALDRWRLDPRYKTLLALLYSLESAYFVSVATLVLERNPYLIYDAPSTRAVMYTAAFNNVMGFFARYFIEHYTIRQVQAQELHGWKQLRDTDDATDAPMAWSQGTLYKEAAVVSHGGKHWIAVGRLHGNMAEPGSWRDRGHVLLWLKPFRLLTLLMFLQICHVVVTAIYALCSDSWVIMGGMVFVNADYMQLLHSIRFAVLGKTARNVMMTRQTTAALPATLQTVIDPNVIANQTISHSGLPAL